MAGEGKDFSRKGNQPHVQMLRGTKHPEWRSAKPSNWLEHRVDAPGWGGGRWRSWWEAGREGFDLVSDPSLARFAC